MLETCRNVCRYEDTRLGPLPPTNLMVFRADFASEEVSKQVESEKAEGAKAGLQGTPTLYFNGKMYRGEPSKEAILAHIDSMLSTLR